jgi:glucosamine-6-phosphate deaminase
MTQRDAKIMKTIVTKNLEELSEQAANLIIEQIKTKPNAVLGLPTGHTPLIMYQKLAQAYETGQVSFAQVKTFNLDEYVGLERTSPDSFYTYMKQHFFDRVDVKQENIFVLDGTAANLTDECANYERELESFGGMDLAVLGIGQDGHIGFCEPGTSWQSRTIVVTLDKTTLNANARDLADLAKMPEQAITMGLGTIMEARQIILLAAGESKRAIVAQSLKGEVSEAVPASILQTHPQVTVILDEAASS